MCSTPVDVTQPWSAIMLTTFRPASAIARFSSVMRPPCSRYAVISSFQGSIA